MVRNNSQLNNSQSQALAENNSTLNIQHSTLRKAHNSKFLIEQFFIACVAANNSKFNIQNSTLPKATIQHSTFNIASATQNPGQSGL